MDEQLLIMLDRQKEVSAQDELDCSPTSTCSYTLTGILSPTGVVPCPQLTDGCGDF